MNQKFQHVILFLFVLAPLFNATVWGVDRSQGESPLWLPQSPELARQIELTENQLAAIQSEIQMTRRKTRTLMRRVEDMRDKIEDFRNRDEEIRRSQLFSIVDEINRLERDIDKMRVSLILKQNQILTPEQRRKLALLGNERRRKKDDSPTEGPDEEDKWERWFRQRTAPQSPEEEWQSFLNIMEEAYRRRHGDGEAPPAPRTIP